MHERGPDGVFAVHGYPIGDGLSTFIVETDEETWQRAGLDEFDVTQPPGGSDLKSKDYLEKLFADQIDGHSLLVNNSRWANFRTRRAARWHHQNVALLGDAAHTAHFSVGSGTKMAMEDAIALARALELHPGDVPSALAAYEAMARPSVEKIQRSARPSLSWWEHFGRYHDALEPWQFSFHFLSRSISADRLARRDHDYVGRIRSAWREQHGTDPLSTPIAVGATSLAGRVLGAADTVRLPRIEAASSTHHSPWTLLVTAPEHEAGLPDALGRLRDGISGQPSLVALQGGSRLTRTLLAEEARMIAGIPTLVVEEDLTEDDAETLVMSGRTDLVATRSLTDTDWSPS